MSLLGQQTIDNGANGELMVTMNDISTNESRRRMIEACGYSMNDNPDDDTRERQRSSARRRDNKSLDGYLRRWINGEIGEEDMLRRMLSIAVSYNYADRQLMDYRDLTPEQVTWRPFAKSVMNVWWALVMRLRETRREEFASCLFEAGLMHDLQGLPEETLWSWLGARGNYDK